MLQVDVHVLTHLGALEPASFVRPVRTLPDGKKAGIVFRRSVYPLYRQRDGNQFYYIRLGDQACDKEGCKLVGQGQSLTWLGAEESVGPVLTDAASARKEQLEWHLESNAFGHYLAFNGDKVQLSRVLHAVQRAGYGYLRAAAGYHAESNGRTYDWFVRLDADDSRDEVLQTLSTGEASLERTFSGDDHSVDSDSQLQLQQQNGALRASIHDLQVRIEATEQHLRSIREHFASSFKRLQDDQHERAKANRDLLAQLRIEKERSVVLMRELDATSLSLRRLAGVEKLAAQARTELRLLRKSSQDTAAELATLRQQQLPSAENASVPAGFLLELNANIKSLEADVVRLRNEEETVRALLSAAESERDQFQLAARAVQQDFELLKLDLETALERYRSELQLTSSSTESLDVLDLEVTDLRTKLSNIEAMQSIFTVKDNQPSSMDDEAADKEQERMSRTDSAMRILATLTTVAFPRLRVAKRSLEEIVDRNLYSEELWRELQFLDRPGELARSSSRIGECGWRELRRHINERTRVYWRPSEGEVLVHVWWKRNDTEQQRLHQLLTRSPFHGFPDLLNRS